MTKAYFCITSRVKTFYIEMVLVCVCWMENDPHHLAKVENPLLYEETTVWKILKIGMHWIGLAQAKIKFFLNDTTPNSSPVFLKKRTHIGICILHPLWKEKNHWWCVTSHHHSFYGNRAIVAYFVVCKRCNCFSSSQNATAITISPTKKNCSYCIHNKS